MYFPTSTTGKVAQSYMGLWVLKIAYFIHENSTLAQSPGDNGRLSVVSGFQSMKGPCNKSKLQYKLLPVA